MAIHIPGFLPAPCPEHRLYPQVIQQAENSFHNPGWQRTYDYEEKYKPDPPGEELKRNARVWKVYMDEAEIYDNDMIQGFREILDVHLVLAALFSAVIVTCAVQTSLDLDPDYAQITAYLMHEQVQLLRSPGNLTAVPSSPFTPESATHTNLDVWINGLFYMSLSLSLAAALLSGLAKQWLTYYSSNVSGHAENRSLHRQFRFNGLQKWKLKDMVGFMPIILHLSLAVFLVGFALFVYRRHSSLSSIVFIISGFTFLFYTISTVLPAIWPECPYQNPALSHPGKIAIYHLTTIYITGIYLVTMARYFLLHLKCNTNHLYSKLRLKLHDTLHPNTFNLRLVDQVYSYSSSLPYRPPPLLHQLNDYTRVDDNADALLADSLLWLVGETTNDSIQTIVIHTGASSVLHLMSTDTNRYQQNIALISLISFACDRLFSHPPPDDEQKISSFLATVITHFNYVAPWLERHPDIPVDIINRTIEYHQTDIISALCGSDTEHIDSQTPYEHGFMEQGRMLSQAARHGQADLVAILLGKGANPNSHPNDFSGTPPLWLAILGSHIHVARYLLEKGAGPNCRHLKTNEHWGSEMCPLHMACLRGDLALLDLLLSYDANPHLTDDEGRSPLHVACAFRQVDAVNKLISLDEPFNIESLEGDNIESRTLLHFLCERWGNADSDDDFDRVAILLLTKDPDMINTRNNEGWTPLHSASHAGDLHAIQYLVDHHANTTLTTDLREHVVHVACDLSYEWNCPKPNSLELIEVPKFWFNRDEHLDINIRDGTNKTPLLRVCGSLWDKDTHGHILAIAECLLSYGADIHAVDGDGWSPLKLGQRYAFDSLTNLLLSKGGGARHKGE